MILRLTFTQMADGVRGEACGTIPFLVGQAVLMEVKYLKMEGEHLSFALSGEDMRGEDRELFSLVLRVGEDSLHGSIGLSEFVCFVTFYRNSDQAETFFQGAPSMSLAQAQERGRRETTKWDQALKELASAIESAQKKMLEWRDAVSKW